VSSAGIFLTHHDSPRIRRHFDRLVEESGSLVTWHLVMSHDALPRPEAPFAYDDPAEVLPVRYHLMEQHGGMQGGYLDTLFVPVLRGLDADHLWLVEYDVDFAGSWGDLFSRFADSDADLLTSTLMFQHEQPTWLPWRAARSPARIPPERWVRSLNPLLRVSRALLETYPAAMSDDHWRGHYEFTLPTAALDAGLRIEDLGGEGSFVPAGHERGAYIGVSPAGKPADLTFGFRPVRHDYFHERPEAFEKPDLLYHPVKPGVPAWTRGTMNVRS
jgi:hypothetical protein